MRLVRFVPWLLIFASCGTCFATDGNRLAYLDVPCNPYYVGLDTPKLTTPQWVGQEGVEAVIVLSVDDLKDPAVFEAFLRPIIERLKKIDGRAPLSLFTNQVDPANPQLQGWLKEGLSLESHTATHPCPCLQNADFASARETFHRNVDRMHTIDNNRPVAFRMPCCDSMSSVSPRFFTEIFAKPTPRGNFLTIDSSVFLVYTADDPALRRDVVVDEDQQERFRKYVPTDQGMANLIENYPYPYVIGNMCWEIPALMPSDWDAQHLRGNQHPSTIRDWEKAVEATVAKQGIFSLVFHPHGWVDSKQIVRLIDHVMHRYRGRVRFMTFREVEEALTKNFLGGHPLRAENGQDNGVRVLDFNNDGTMDVLVDNKNTRQRRVWLPAEQKWEVGPYPKELATVDSRGRRCDTDIRFGVFDETGVARAVFTGSTSADGARNQNARDQGIRLRDIDGDGRCEMLVGNLNERAVFQPARNNQWRRLPFSLPEGIMFVDEQGNDAGLRMVDIDEDGRLDVVFSNAERYSIHLFTSMKEGWSRKVLSGRRDDPNVPASKTLPPIVRADGTNNGAWFANRHMWVQNEDTGGIAPGHVESRWYTELLAAETKPPMRTPEQSLAAMRPRPGMKVELMAAEPLVMDPIDMAWGPDGKLWVVEMADYPMGMDEEGHLGPPERPGIPGGRVRYLEDTDGDGRYDKSTVFLEPVGWPSGVMPWRNGVLVTAAPELFYAEDTDGDGKADVCETLFTGFIEGNQQHRINHPRWGLDNWVHLANGDSNGRIHSTKTGDVADIRGRDLRVRPDTGKLDAQAGATQHGRNRDNWGNWFGCNNPNPGWHYALADHYIRRNPHLAAPSPKVDLIWSRDSFPIGRVITHCFYDQPTPAEGQPGIWTCICSSMIYRDSLLGGQFHGNLFTSDAVYNVVHRMQLEPKGPTFSGHRAVDEQKSEFLASSDPWFRPTTIRTGPDGALWVADMHRVVIEHPEWIDDALEKTLDLREGHDKGRLYRIYPVDKDPRPIPRLDRLDTRQLVGSLSSRNGWQRDMAQQMLIWRADKSAIGPLEHIVIGKSHALARLHALCTLDGMNALRHRIVLHGLHDHHPGVRRHAIRLAEQFVSKHSELGEALLKLVEDPDDQVRMQLAYTLGEWDDPRAGRALGRLAVRAARDPLQLAAVMSSATNALGPMTTEILADAKEHQGQLAGQVDLIAKLLTLAVALEDDQAVVSVFRQITARPESGHAPWQYAMLGTLFDGLDRQSTSLEKILANSLSKEDDQESKKIRKQLDSLFQAARDVVENEEAVIADRTAAMRILGRGLDRREEDLERLAGLLVPRSPMELQLAAVAAMGRLPRKSVPELLLNGWAEQSPKLHNAIVDVLLRREPWIKTLLDECETRPELVSGLDTTRRSVLLRHRSNTIRRRAEELLGTATTKAEIQAVLDRFQPVVNMSGDPARGKEVFNEVTCVDCHKLQDIGKHVGPDLRTLIDKSPQALLVATFDPNRAMEDRFMEYTALTADGLMLTGMLLEETGNSITLADAQGELHVILRRDLEELVANNRSHMPEGLEAKLDLRKMADLIAFIARTGLPRKEFPGNRPEIIRAGGDGSLRLPAAAASLHGPAIVFEQRFKNLGYWSSPEAYAVWTLELEKGGQYDVWFDWACTVAEAKKPFLLQVSDQTIRGEVRSTGFWERYDTQKFGRIELAPGEHRLTFRSDGPISRPMIDLRTIILVPVTP